ncbi:polymer-forming cytoskeletal protein [Noviherbaspirillum galbum]|uniref:Polymer-forming cytoskeletal protein n=1 Tax=Noviherbaspirillum galbum TaxID=2709383 RepID=A0A6B3SVG7_9BURK|nr:polymer-forming cytoskeletal protein [Noviherbaspirillum galbum]NEX62372.1 polymer-forming cytoskeletal protein [Noviherbaspirillum galbum]
MATVYRPTTSPSPGHALAGFALMLACLLQPVHAEVRTEGGNAYHASGEVRMTESVPGDLYAVGGRVMLLAPVGEDVAIAGGSVRIDGDVGQDLRVAGGSVDVTGKVGGDLVASGGQVRVGKESVVKGEAALAGGEVTMAGTLERGARIYANRIVIDGPVRGKTELYAQEITFAPGARIDGDLHYASRRPLAADARGKVSGSIVQEEEPRAWEERAHRRAGGFHPFFILSMFACGMLLQAVFPNAIAGVRQSMTSAPLKSIGIGLALLFTLPPLGVLLLVTLVGIPLGLGVFALYPLLLLLGYLAAAFFLGGLLARMMHAEALADRRRQVLFFALALLVLGLVGTIPVVGWLVVFIALLEGIGGWASWTLQRYRAARTSGHA